MKAVHSITGAIISNSSYFLRTETCSHNPENINELYSCDEGVFIGKVSGDVILWISWA